MSVYIERMTQMLSTCSPTSGKRSLTSMPLWPYFLNANGDFISAPVFRSVAMLPPGSGWPWYFSSIGFGSKLSTCESPPFMKRKMTCFARAGWCRPVVCAASSSEFARLANAIMPKPLAIRHRASRRVTGCPSLWRMSVDRCQCPVAGCESVNEEEFGGAHEDLQVATQRRDRQHLLLVVLGSAAAGLGDAGHHALAHLGLVLRVLRCLRFLLLFFFRLRVVFLPPLFVGPQRFGRQELEAGRHFLRLRIAAEQNLVSLRHTGRVVLLPVDPPRQPLGLLLHEVAVHQEQPLQRDVRAEALLGADRRGGKVEELRELIELVAADPAIERAARGRPDQILGRPAHFLVERAGDEERRVAHFLRRHAAAVHAPVPAVAGVFRERRRRVVVARLIDRTQHQQPLEFLDRVSVVGEPAREILEQLGVARLFAELPEVARRVDEARAEVPLPDAVHDDAPRDRLMDDCIGQFHPSAALRERWRVAADEDRREMTRDLVARLEGIAADGDVDRNGLLHVLHAVDVGVLRRHRLRRRLDVLTEIVDVAAAIGAEPAVERRAAEHEQPWLVVFLGGGGIGAVDEIRAEHVRIQEDALARQALELEAAARTEVVVGDELVR